MSEFLNALQAASNTAAGTVSGPVDLLAWALRKAGVQIPQDAMGSSEWMKRQGLMKDVKPGVSQMVGDTVGLLSPVAAAAYGPQIARGLLKGGENLAQPRTLNPETGAIVWHGSPHKFDKFDSSKIGTGEGAQAYGHGLYLADAQDVAGSYAKMNPASTVKVSRVWPSREWPNGGYEALATRDSGPLVELGQFATRAEAEKAAQAFRDASANLYKVDLPDEAIAKMLDWDANLSEQAPEVQKALEKLPADVKAHLGIGKYSDLKGGIDIFKPLGGMVGDNKAASLLRQQGIPGIRYLDGGSRAAGQGSRNYVVFDDSLLSILERNGIPIK